MHNTTTNILYKKGYQYQLAVNWVIFISICPRLSIETDYIKLSNNGLLTIKKGYAWDGATGAIDSKNFMRGALVHDALYQLMREQKLDANKCKEPADRILQTLCRADGMSRFRAWYVYKAVQLLGKAATRQRNKKPLLQAPAKDHLLAKDQL